MIPNSPIRVLIADDHTIVRDGLRNILEKQSDISVVGEQSSAVGIVKAVEDSGCNVLLMDLTMPNGGGFQGLEALRAAHSSVRTLILTVHDDPERLQRALSAGALGYLTKRASAQVLVEAVRETAAGRSCVDIGPGAPGGNVLQRLSRREREVLHLIALGYTNQEAAGKLEVSTKSVEGYRRRMVQKIGASNRAEIVKFALKNGLLSSDG
ncbi:MAG: DNA-binding NarL/FixJ family response regulator [Myxococcota bacterium]|jgi:DNA-binding NarL/FixJ family response regulator